MAGSVGDLRESEFGRKLWLYLNRSAPALLVAARSMAKPHTSA